YNKTPYELLRDRKPDLKFLYVFGALCYLTNDSEDLGKLKPKADIGIFIGLVPNSASSTSSNPQSKKDLDILFQPMFDEYLKPQPSAVSTTLSAATLPPDTARTTSLISIDQDAPSPSTTPNTKTISTPIQDANFEDPNQEDEDAEFNSGIFTNLFAPRDTSSVESLSSRIVDTSNMNTLQQSHSHTRRWTKDHPLVTIIGNPSKPVSTRRQLATDGIWCYFPAFLTKVEPKNYKEAMKESS
ncbi:hypothetical protein Tco_0042337, partial [Tanacetum coccineum]